MDVFEHFLIKLRVKHPKHQPFIEGRDVTMMLLCVDVVYYLLWFSLLFIKDGFLGKR